MIFNDILFFDKISYNAIALPAPISDKDLFNKSDAIFDINVIEDFVTRDLFFNDKSDKYDKDYDGLYDGISNENISNNTIKDCKIEDDKTKDDKTKDDKMKYDAKKNDMRKKKIINYAIAKVNNIIKNDRKIEKDDMILLCWYSLPRGLIGGWSVSFKKGESCNIYLIWNNDKSCYSATYWHAKNYIN